MIGWEEQIALAAARPTFDEPVQRHAKWLMKKLYEQRERNGDVVFVFPIDDGGMPDIDIPVPEHALANKPDKPDADMREEEIIQVRCHRQVLVS